jgi:hypothetical protein
VIRWLLARLKYEHTKALRSERDHFANLLNDVAIALDDEFGIAHRINRTPAQRVRELAARSK